MFNMAISAKWKDVLFTAWMRKSYNLPPMESYLPCGKKDKDRDFPKNENKQNTKLNDLKYPIHNF